MVNVPANDVLLPGVRHRFQCRFYCSVSANGWYLSSCFLQGCATPLITLSGRYIQSGWWFGTFFIFLYIGKKNPNWLRFFRGVETTNQQLLLLYGFWTKFKVVGHQHIHELEGSERTSPCFKRTVECDEHDCLFWTHSHVSSIYGLLKCKHMAILIG